MLMRKKKRLLMTILTCILVLSFSSICLAVPMFGYTYTPDGTNSGQNTDWQHQHTNASYGEDQITMQVSRTKSTSCTTSVSVSVDYLIYQGGCGIEVAIGSSSTTSWSVLFTCPEWQVTLCKSGSMWKQPYGTQKYYAFWICTSTQNVNMKKTYMSWSGKSMLYYIPH